LFEKGNTKIRFLTFGGKEKRIKRGTELIKQPMKLIRNSIILEQFMMLIGKILLVFMIMKPIIIGKTIITTLGTKTLKNGIWKLLFT
jgi:hypothetical protein